MDLTPVMTFPLVDDASPHLVALNLIMDKADVDVYRQDPRVAARYDPASGLFSLFVGDIDTLM